MEISALSSGSTGNCYYVKENRTSILIDAGISCKQIVERLNIIKQKPESIQAIFITHEHSDHIRGADVLSRNFNIPIFLTKKTSKSRFICSNEENINLIKNNERVKIGNLSIESLSKSHKAEDPVFYKIESNKKLSIITDLGIPCQNTMDAISDSDFLCMESNHDVNMLEDGPYPYFLKNWIKSDSGHLSNLQSSLAVLEYGRSRLKNLMLCHLSQTNNTPQIALSNFKLLKERADLHPHISISSFSRPTQLFKI